MNTAKYWKSSSLRSWQKKSYSIKKLKSLLFSTVAAALMATYLEMICVGIGLYSFPTRPFPDVFTIHIGFTLLVMPFTTVIFLLIFEKLNRLGKTIMLIMSGVIAVASERVAEQVGLLIHSQNWQHLYSFFGYIVFFLIVWIIYSLFD